MQHRNERPILVIDDDEDIREAVRDTLEDEGCAVVVAAGGEEALRYLRTHPPPPLVLLDWNMAPMNAPSFMAEYAKEPTFGRAPVVLLTADMRVMEKSRSGVYAGYLEKPVKLHELFAIVDRYVH